MIPLSTGLKVFGKKTDFIDSAAPAAESAKSSSDNDRVRNLFHILSHAVQNSSSKHISLI